MGTVSTINAPSSTSAVELGARSQGHDQIDFAIGVSMMRANDVFHVDDIGAETPGAGAGFEYAPELDPTGFTVAHPPTGDAGLAGIENRLKLAAAGRHRAIQFRFEIRIERPIADCASYLADQRLKNFLLHDERRIELVPNIRRCGKWVHAL